MAQRLYIFGAKRFEDPGAMYLEETIGIVRSLVEWKERNERSIRINTETKVKNDTRIRDWEWNTASQDRRRLGRWSRNLDQIIGAYASIGQANLRHSRGWVDSDKMAKTQRNMRRIRSRTLSLHPKGLGWVEKCEGTGIWAVVGEDPGEEVGSLEAMLNFISNKRRKKWSWKIRVEWRNTER